MGLFWFALSYIGLGYTTLIMFVALTHVKGIIERGTDLTLFWKVMLYPLYWVALVFDLVFNVFIGSPMFWEWPHELMFTARCKRWKQVDLYPTWKSRLAMWWCKQLNQMDPGHC